MNGEPTLSPETPSPQKRETISRTFLATFAAALATGLAGVLLSSGFLNKVVGVIYPDRLPSGAIIFVREQDCGGADSQWRPLQRGQGRLVVIADGKDFRADDSNDNGKLSFKNLELPQSNGGRAGFTFVNGLKMGDAPDASEGDKEITLRPPWMALTACERKSN